MENKIYLKKNLDEFGTGFSRRRIVNTICIVVFLIMSIGTAFSQCACDHVIAPTDMSGGILSRNGITMGVQPGDKVCIMAGNYPGKIILTDFEGTATNPVLIVNCGGQVVVSTTSGTAIEVKSSQFFKFSGRGDSGYDYGIKVTGSGPGANGLGIGGFSTDFEIEGFEISNTGFAGIMSKTEPTCDNRDLRYFVQRNSIFHDNYIHHTGGEGFYVGHTFWPVWNGPTCDGVTVTAYPHSMEGVKIYNNIVEHTGWDGIQLSATAKDGSIFNNIIRDHGTKDNDVHGNGIQLSNNIVCWVYNNKILPVTPEERSGYSNGIVSWATATRIFNNLIVNAGSPVVGLRMGIQVYNSSNHFPDSSNYILNNTIINAAKAGISMFHGNDNNKINNNIIVSQTGYYIKDAPSGTDTNNNYLTSSISNPGFSDSEYHLSETSPCIDAGVNRYSYGVKFDLDNNPRPSSGPFEQGAYEYDGENPPDPSSWSLFINAGGDTYNEQEGSETIEWEADLACQTCTPHPTLDPAYQSYGTGSTAAFNGPNATTAPNQVLGTYRYTLNSGTTIRYAIPVPSSGTYDIELFFARKNADTFVSGDRRFNIIVEGQTVTTYDVYDQGGTGGTAASSYQYTAQVTDGVLELKFVAVAGAHAMINDIWVKLHEQTPDPESLSLFINSGGDEYVASPITWERDLSATPHETLDASYQTYATGSTAAFNGANSTSAPSQVLGTYRYTLNAGTTIRYEIPVPSSGTYDIELYFARKNADTFVSGDRRFNIIIEGQTVTTYDVYDAGGTNGTAASSYPYSAEVIDGILEIKFVAVAGAHSMINAIRVEGPVESGSLMESQTARMTTTSTQEQPVLRAVYPNPLSDELKIDFDSDDVYQVKILTTENDLYLNTVVESKKGNSQTIDVSGIPDNQMFILYIQSSKGTKIYKIFKGRR